MSNKTVVNKSVETLEQRLTREAEELRKEREAEEKQRMDVLLSAFVS